MPAPASLQPQLFSQFANLIHARSGLAFMPTQAGYLAPRLQQRANALKYPDLQSYFTFLNSPSGEKETGPLLDNIAIHATSFYRNMPQLNACLSSVIIPLIAARKTQGQTRFRIWSAACSTGDELYTLALMLKDNGLLTSGLTFELIGSDISPASIKTAEAASYPQSQISSVPTSVLRPNFTFKPKSQTWQLNTDIKNLCTFRTANLMNPIETGLINRADVIFCRNTLQYFDKSSRNHVLQNLAHSLASDGTLIFGHTEDISSPYLRASTRHPASLRAFHKI